MKGIPHFFEDDLLSLDDLIGIVVGLSIGDIPTYEKIDGVNLFVTHDGLQWKIGKTKSHLLSGGLDRQGVQSYYRDHPVLKTLTAAIDQLEAKCKSANELSRIFCGGSVWYNFEVVDKDNPNVFEYPKSMLCLHANGHYLVKNGELEPHKDEEDLYVFAQTLNSSQKGVFEAPIREARKTTLDEDLLESFLYRGRKLAGRGVPSSRPMRDHYIAKISEAVSVDFPKVPMPVCELMAKKIYGERIRLKEITRYVRDKKGVKKYLKDKRGLRDAVKKPTKNLMREFATELVLENPSRILPEESSRNVKRRLVEEVAEYFERYGSDKENDEIDSLFEEIGDETRIPGHEGFVFEYNGKTYKATGNFPVVNKLIWMKKRKAGNSRKVGFFPGKFKPPHLGHWMQVEELLEEGLEEVRVLISPLTLETVTPEISERIWKKMARHEPRVKVEISAHRSPVRQVYQDLADLPRGTIAYVGSGDKEDVSRFENAKSWLAEKKPDIFLEIVEGRQNSKKISGTSMRKLLLKEKAEEFMKGLPEHLTREQRIAIWEILKNR